VWNLLPNDLSDAFDFAGAPPFAFKGGADRDDAAHETRRDPALTMVTRVSILIGFLKSPCG
jgi:hypothetical protein